MKIGKRMLGSLRTSTSIILGYLTEKDNHGILEIKELGENHLSIEVDPYIQALIVDLLNEFMVNTETKENEDNNGEDRMD